MIVQIYGLTTASDADAVARLGPDHAGVVLDEGIDTWDSVDERTMRAIVAALRPVKIVALSLSTDPDRVRRTAGLVEPDIVHLARAAGSMTPDDVDRLRATLRPVEVMVTVPVRGGDAVQTANRLLRAATTCSSTRPIP